MTIETFERSIAKVLVSLAILHVPLLFAIAIATTRDRAISIGGLALVFAAVPLTLTWLHRPVKLIALSLAIALVGQVGLLVFLFHGHPWQTEMHFYFFGVLAMLAGFCDATVLVAAATLIAAHHVVLDALMPEALYAGGSDHLRLVIHAAFVVVETAMLVHIAHAIKAAMLHSQRAQLHSKAAVERASKLGAQLDQQLQTSTHRADSLEASLDLLRGEIGESLANLAGAARILQQTADDFSSATKQTTAQAEGVLGAANAANLKADDVVDAGLQFVAMMNDIRALARSSADMSGHAAGEADSTVSVLEELTRVSAQIEDAVTLITRISGQTNLLALNATIEAARAGEQGRAFAIVAGEVKSLANEAGKAASAITEMVKSIRLTTLRSVDATTSIAASIRDLNSASGTILNAVIERTQIAEGMASNTRTAASEVATVAASIGTILSVARESSQGADFVRLAAQGILEQAESIRRQIDGYATTLNEQRLRAIG